MIEMIKVNQGTHEYWIVPESIISLEITSLDVRGIMTKINVFGGNSHLVDQTPEQILALMNGKPSAPLDELQMVLVTEITRGETRNSGSPMWRCETDDDSIRFNIFQHSDPVKNNYALFQAAGWSRLLDRINLYEDVTEYGLIVALKKSGQWWEVVKVRPFLGDADNGEPVLEGF